MATGGTQSNEFGLAPSVSADGRYVAFTAAASNLVADDTNGTGDVFVHDREAGIIERVSAATDGTQSNNRSERATISADGRHVAFESRASNLVPGDTNGAMDVFVHDRHTTTTERASVATGGTQDNHQS